MLCGATHRGFKSHRYRKEKMPQALALEGIFDAAVCKAAQRFYKYRNVMSRDMCPHMSRDFLVFWGGCFGSFVRFGFGLLAFCEQR